VAGRPGSGPAADADRAIPWLERLASEHPLATQRSAGLLWLARAYAAAGRTADACLTARAAAGTSERDAELARLLEDEERAACPHAPDTVNPPVNRGREPAAVRAAAPEPPATNHAFTVQVAAMTERPRAEALARQLRSDGFDVRVVSLQGSALLRVRVGLFATRAEAGLVARRVRDAGHDAIIVDDARRETGR
jgi:cell division septation protein DedD